MHARGRFVLSVAAVLAGSVALCPVTALAEEVQEIGGLTVTSGQSFADAPTTSEQHDDARAALADKDGVGLATPAADAVSTDSLAPATTDSGASDATDAPADPAAPDAPTAPGEDDVAPTMPTVVAPGSTDIDDPGTSEVELHRFHNAGTGEYRFTADPVERNALLAAGWVDEGVAWNAPSNSPDAAFELTDPSTGSSYYTSDMGEYVDLVSKGWGQEGMAWYVSDEDEGAPVYYLTNPNASSGNVFFTQSALDRLSLTANGWTYQGIACYGVDDGPAAPVDAVPESWVDSGGSRFYILADGTPATGWQTIDGVRYCFDDKGRLLTGVSDVSGTVYSFNADGTARSGWQDLVGHRYYFGEDGSLWHGGWLSLGGSTYYLDPVSGVMQTTDRWIDGVMRPFASNGVCLKTGYQTSWGGLTLAARDVTLPSYANGSYWSYVHPCIISPDATREQVIEAFISVAYEYMYAGTRWVDNNCGAPGTTVDCSGLVMEALYAVGMDLTGAAGGDYNPYSKYYWNHHFANSWRLNNTFQPISFSDLERGDIIYYEGHVVIYLGNGQIIESTSDASNVRVTNLYYTNLILGCARPFTK